MEKSSCLQLTLLLQKTEYFNLTMKGLGYLSNVRQVNHQNGSFLSCVINALSGPTDNPSYTRFDVTVAGKEATTLISRCQKAVDEDRKVLLGFYVKQPCHRHFHPEQGGSMPVSNASA